MEVNSWSKAMAEGQVMASVLDQWSPTTGPRFRF